MKYIVERASKMSYDKPCDNSYLEKLDNPHKKVFNIYQFGL